MTTMLFTELARDVSGGNLKLAQSEYQETGSLPVVDQGKSFIAGYTDRSEFAFKSADLPVIVFGDHTRAVKFVDFPFAMGADGVKVISTTAECDPKFLYHYLRQVQIPNAGYSRHYKFLKELRLKIPPISEQLRIAAILDKADALRAKRREAIAKLDQLLQSVFLEMFGDPTQNSMNWPVIPFTEVGDWRSGGTPSKGNTEYWSGEFPWVSPKDMKVPEIYDAQDHVSDKVFNETSLKRIDVGSLLIVVRGMILAHSFPTAINRVPVAINQDMKAIRPGKSFQVEYLKACVDALKDRLLGVVSTAGHGTRRLDTRSASEIMIPMPPVSAQNDYSRFVQQYRLLRGHALNHLHKLEIAFSSLQSESFSNNSQ